MLPDLIEIIPPTGAAPVRLTVPGSKSITNRALILAALAGGTTRLRGALWSEDTEIMQAALSRLGYSVASAPDADEPGNRTLTVTGKSGAVPHGGTDSRPLELNVGNAGTAARFLAAFLCLGAGAYRLDGTKRMRERPQAPLFQALRQLGYRIESANDALPAVIHGGGPRPGVGHVSTEKSSQFASALLLGAAHGGWKPVLDGDAGEEGAYITMTRHLIDAFPRNGGDFQIEPDASSASYFAAAGYLLGRQVEIHAYPTSGWQIDGEFPKFLPLPKTVSRRNELGDSIMTAIVLAPFAKEPVTFTDLQRLRVQECERVAALRTELQRCGAKVEERGETLTVFPSDLHGAEIETYEDHRMAMCFAILGLKTPGIKLKNPNCVKKTFPNFFQKLAAPAPDGLGAAIVDAHGRQLAGDTLLAE